MANENRYSGTDSNGYIVKGSEGAITSTWETVTIDPKTKKKVRKTFTGHFISEVFADVAYQAAKHQRTTGQFARAVRQ
mgnify:FL=1